MANDDSKPPQLAMTEEQKRRYARARGFANFDDAVDWQREENRREWLHWHPRRLR